MRHLADSQVAICGRRPEKSRLDWPRCGRGEPERGCRSASRRKLRVRLVLLAFLVQMSLFRRTLPDGHAQLRLLPGLHLDRLATGRSERRPDDGVPGAARDPLDLET